MPTQLPISVDEITIKWRQPYVSEALNRKAKADDGGIIRGYELKINPDVNAPNTVILDVDAQTGDSAMNIINSTDPEYAVAWVRDTALVIEVPNVAGYQHLFANHGYTEGSDTVPTLTWYSTAEITVVDPPPGMYIGSVDIQIGNVKTFYSITSKLAFKRSTPSAFRGAKGRVDTYYDENTLLYTDFSDRRFVPIDDNPTVLNRVSASIISREMLAGNNVTTISPLSNIQTIYPETNRSVLLFWRTDADVTNRPDVGNHEKRFILPYFVPCVSQWDSDADERILRFAVRIAGFRNRNQRPANQSETDKWRLAVNLTLGNVPLVTGPNIVPGQTVTTDTFLSHEQVNNYTLTSDEIDFQPLDTTTDGFKDWGWQTGQIYLPNKDSQNNPISILGFSVSIIIPDMRNDEFLAIDRLVVEGENIALVDAFDSAHNLGGMERYGSIGASEITRSTELTPSVRALNLVPSNCWGLRASGNTQFLSERIKHNINIGLPLRDRDHIGRLEGYADDTVFYDSEGSAPIQFKEIRNLFRQSNVNIYAPGQYETRSLISALNATNALVPDSLKAPFRAGLTIHNGNLFALRSASNLSTEYESQNTPPSNLTGYLVAEGGILANTDYIERGTYDFDTGVATPTPRLEVKSLMSDNFQSQISNVFAYLARHDTAGYFDGTFRNGEGIALFKTDPVTSGILDLYVDGLRSDGPTRDGVSSQLSFFKYNNMVSLIGAPFQTDTGLDGNGSPAIDFPLIGIRVDTQKRVMASVPIDSLTAQLDQVMALSTNFSLNSSSRHTVNFRQALGSLLGGSHVEIPEDGNPTDDEGGDLTAGGFRPRLYYGTEGVGPYGFSTDPVSGAEVFQRTTRVYRFQEDSLSGQADGSVIRNKVTILSNILPQAYGDVTLEPMTESRISYQNPLSNLVGSNDDPGRYKLRRFGGRLYDSQIIIPSSTELTGALSNDNDLFGGELSATLEHLAYMLQPLDKNGDRGVHVANRTAVGFRFQQYFLDPNDPNYPFTGLSDATKVRDTLLERNFVRNVFLKLQLSVLPKGRLSNAGFTGTPGSFEATYEAVCTKTYLVNMYQYVAYVFGLIDSNSNFIWPQQNGVDLSDLQYSVYIRQRLLGGIPWNLDLENLTTTDWSSLTNQGLANGESTDRTFGQIQTQLEALSFSPNILDPYEYDHIFTISTLYKSSYGSIDRRSHPINLSPAYREIFCQYENSSL